MGALFPTLSRLFVESKAALSYSCARSVRYLAMLGIPAAIGIALLADQIIRLLYGPTWESSIPALRILIWAWALICMNCVCPVALNAANKTNLSVLVTLVGIGVNIVLNLILIPFLSIIGASLATVGTEVVNSLLYFYFINRYICHLRPFDFARKPFLASMLMASGLVAVKSQISNVVILVMVGVVLYVGFLTLLRGFDEADRRLVQSLVRWLVGVRASLRSAEICGE